MNNIKYSIIIPHKNNPELLTRCIGSIPNRNDVEIIIVDDDSDKQVVDFNNFPGSKRNNVKIIYNKICKGAGHARNLGMKEANGEWLLFADADDYYVNHFIDTLDKYLENDLDILFFNFHSYSYNAEKSYDEYFFRKKDEDIVRLKWMPWNKVFSHKLIKNNNLSFEEIPVGNDAMFSLKANFIAKKILIIYDKLYYYTDDNKNSISLKKRDFNRELDYLRVNLRINSLLRTNKKNKYTMPLLAPKYVYKLINLYGFSSFIKYLSLLRENSLITREIFSWIRYKLKKIIRS